VQEQQAALSTEERGAIAQMVCSPGWYVLMRVHILPALQQATHNLDSPNINENHANIQRGIKVAFMRLIERVYKIAELPNPFEKHAEALLASLESYTTTLPHNKVEPTQITIESKAQERSRRASYPV